MRLTWPEAGLVLAEVVRYYHQTSIPGGVVLAFTEAGRPVLAPAADLVVTS